MTTTRAAGSTGERVADLSRRARHLLLRVSGWLRSNSERYLLEAAQTDVAQQLGRPPPVGPTGPVATFWRRVYVPVYHRIPWRVRHTLMSRMPGSHRRTWHRPPTRRNPAI
jgi:hypothetical protein